MLFVPTARIADEFIIAARRLLENEVLGVCAPELITTRTTKRDMYFFGYGTYSCLVNDDFSFTQIPKFLHTLSEHARAQLEAKTGQRPGDASPFNNCIISAYEPGFKLAPHIDAHKSKPAMSQEGRIFYYDDILGVVVEADEEGKLYLLDTPNIRDIASGTARKHFIEEEDGTVYLLNGAERLFYHGVSDIKRRRLSIVFTHLRFGS